MKQLVTRLAAIVVVTVLGLIAPRGAQAQATFDLGSLIPGAVSSEVQSVAPNGNVAGVWRDSAGALHAFWWTLATGVVYIPMPSQPFNQVFVKVNAHGVVAVTCLTEQLQPIAFTWSQS